MGEVAFELCGRGACDECEVNRVERQAIQKIWCNVIASELFLEENVVRGRGFDLCQAVWVETECAVGLVQCGRRRGHPGCRAATVQVDRRGGERPIEKSTPVKFIEYFLVSRFTFERMHRSDREAATRKERIVMPWVSQISDVPAMPD